MRLYILRHGHAPSASQARVSSDAERPLSPQGRRDARQMAVALHASGGRPSLILTSPLKRAIETAEEVSGILSPPLGVRRFDPLANQIPGEALYERLLSEFSLLPSGRGGAGAEVLIVGHMPQVGELAAHLVGHAPEFRPAGLAAVEIAGSAAAPGRAALLWSKNP